MVEHEASVILADVRRSLKADHDAFCARKRDREQAESTPAAESQVGNLLSVSFFFPLFLFLTLSFDPSLTPSCVGFPSPTVFPLPPHFTGVVGKGAQVFIVARSEAVAAPSIAATCILQHAPSYTVSHCLSRFKMTTPRGCSPKRRISLASWGTSLAR